MVTLELREMIRKIGMSQHTSGYLAWPECTVLRKVQDATHFSGPLAALATSALKLE